MFSLVSAEPSARGCGVCAMRPSGVTRSDSRSTPLRPPWMIPGSPLLISAASVCSNLRSMAALMGAGILPVAPHDPQSVYGERALESLNGTLTRLGSCLCPGDLFGLTKATQVSQHLRQFPLESRARQPVRDISRRVDVDAIAQQCPLAVLGRLEFPHAFVGLEVAAHLVERDAAIGDEIRTEYITKPRGVPAEVDFLLDQRPARIGRAFADSAHAKMGYVFHRIDAAGHR